MGDQLSPPPLLLSHLASWLSSPSLGASRLRLATPSTTTPNSSSSAETSPSPPSSAPAPDISSTLPLTLRRLPPLLVLLRPLHTAPGAAQDVDGRCCTPEAAAAEACEACLLAAAAVGSAWGCSAGAKDWKASELGVDARRAPANAVRTELVCTRRGRRRLLPDDARTIFRRRKKRGCTP